MATVCKVYTTEEQRSVVRFLETVGVSSRDIHKEMFLVCGGKCLSLEAFTTGAKRFAVDVEV
jgi:hypothetical protein